MQRCRRSIGNEAAFDGDVDIGDIMPFFDRARVLPAPRRAMRDSFFAHAPHSMHDSKGDRANVAATGRDARSRTFVDDDGHRWKVSEQLFSEYDRRRGRSLIFESELAVRRVRDYPSDWFTLDDAALVRLSWGV